MDIGGFKINPMIFEMFGGKFKKKKAKQKRKKKSKKHLDYSKIKLNKIDTDSKKPIEPIEPIEIKNDVICRVYEEESLNSNIENPSVEYINDSINVDNTYYKYKNRIELQCKDNKSRDSECDMNEEDEEHNELIINDNDNDNGDSIPRFNINYSASPAVCSEIFSICSDNDFDNDIANEEIDLNDTQFGNDLFLDMDNINAVNARESEIESPSISNQTDSPSYKYEYNFSDITTIGAIKTPKITPRIPIVENEPEPIFDLLGNTYGIYDESFSLSYSDIEQHEIDTNNNYDINNIGYIGAIHTSEFIENKTFKENRRKSIHSDLLDMIVSGSDISDYDNDNEDDDDDEKDYGMTIIELLHLFKIDSFMCYFNKILCIQYVNEIINYEPNIIKRGLICNNIQIQINIYKMLKYLSKQVINGNLNGLKSKQWIELENNTIYNIFGYKSNYLLNYENSKNNINKNNLKYKHWDYIGLNNFDRKYVQNINVHKTLDNPMELKIIINQLPDKYRFEPGLFKIGIENKHNDHISSIYIDDRLIIKQNDKYKNTLHVGNNFIENGCGITMKIKTIKPSARRKYLSINISHEPRNNGPIYCKNYKLKLHKHKNTTKVFIEQFNGFGEYAVLY